MSSQRYVSHAQVHLNIFLYLLPFQLSYIFYSIRSEI